MSINLTGRKKRILLIIGLLLLVVLAFYLEMLGNRPPEEDRTQTPVVRPGQPGDVSLGTLTVVAFTPPEGAYTNLSTLEPILVDFSDPVDIQTLSWDVKPKVELDPLYFEDYPNRIVFTPQKEGWLPGVLYTLKITALSSTNGKALQETVSYTYINTPPPQEEYDKTLPF